MSTRLLVVASLLAPLTAQAGALSPWGVHTSAGETWLTPYVFVGQGSVSNATYLSIGLGKHFDLIGGAGVGWADGFEPGALEVMPRFFLTDNVGVVVRVASVPGMAQLEVGPEIHAGWTAGRFALTTNVGWRPALGTEGGVGGAFAVVAPELYLSDAVSLYVEVNPSVDLTDPSAVSLTVVPGFSVAVGNHSFALGAMLPTDDPAQNFVVGGWYSVLLGRADG